MDTKRFCRFAALFLLMGSAACGGSGTTNGESPDQQDEASDAGIKLFGRVAVPFAVAGAEVQAYLLAHPDFEPDGAVLASATTASDGLFEMAIPASLPPGAVIHLVAGGLGAKVALPSGPLSAGSDTAFEAAFIWEGELTGNVTVDLWSTLAVCRIVGVAHLNPMSGKDVKRWQELVLESNQWMGEHLLRPNPVRIPWQEPGDLNRDELVWPSPASALALANLGLWRMGQGDSPSNDISDLRGAMDALRVDLSDGVLDGRGMLNPSDEGASALPDLTADYTRHDLARAIHAALQQPGFPLAEPPSLDLARLGVKGEFYEDLSLDTSPLYPEEQAGRLFDPFPPAFEFSVAPSGDGPELCKGFTVEVQASDNNRIEAITLQYPDWPELTLQVTLDEEAGTGKATVQIDPMKALLAQEATLLLRFVTSDPAGNEVMIERTLPLHQSVPSLSQSSPTDDVCLGAWPETFTVRATDDKGIARVEVQHEGGVYPCTPTTDDLWQCPRKGEEPVVTATDECGLSAELVGSFCVDGEPPVITYQLATPMCGPAAHSATVSVTDNMGVQKVEVTAGGVTTPVEAFDQPFEVFFPLDGSDPAEVSITAWDIWNRTSTEVLTCPLDIQAPLMWAKEGALILRAESEQVSFLIAAKDALSVVTDVAVTADDGTWQVAASGEDWLVTGTVEGGFKDSMVISLAVTATDEYGNSTLPYPMTVIVDGIAPALGQVDSTFKDEAGVIPSVDTGTLEVSYDISGAPPIQWGEAQCAEGCPSFTKLPTLLSEEGTEDLAERNLPHFRFEVTEPCGPGLAAGGKMVVAANYYRDDTLLLSTELEEVPCGYSQFVVPLSLERFSQLPMESFEFASDNLPNLLVVQVQDEVGHLSEMEVSFTMQVAPLAPLLNADVPTQLDSEWVGGCVDPDDPQLHLVADEGRILTRHKLVNPYPIPLEVRVTGAPNEKVTVMKLMFYNNPKTTALFQCVPNSNCKYWLPETPEGQCQAPIDFATADLYKVASLPTRTFWQAPEALVASAGEEFFVLAPFSEVWLETRNEYAGFTLDAPVSLAVDVGVEEPAYVVAPAGSSAECLATSGQNSIHYDLPTVLSWFSSQQVTSTKLVWESALLGQEVKVENTKSVSWMYFYLPPFEMHEVPWK